MGSQQFSSRIFSHLGRPWPLPIDLGLRGPDPIGYDLAIATVDTRTTNSGLGPAPTSAAVKPLGGLMRWRMHAKGYPAGQAWFWETSWVYGIGLLGYGAYLLLVWMLSWLTGSLRVDLTLFHCLVWVFFLLAHLPDLLRTQAPGTDPCELPAHSEPTPGNDPYVPTQDEASARDPAKPGSGETTPAGWWHLLLPLLIAGINLGIAFRSADVYALLASVVSDAEPILLTAATHLAIVGSAYAIHAAVNLITLLSSRRHPGAAPKPGPARRPLPDPKVPDAPMHPSPANPLPPDPAPARGSRRQAVPLWPARPRISRGPLSLLVEHLKRIPEKELRPTLRLIGAVAMGKVHRLDTPVLADTTHQVLCHRDGSLNGALLARFLLHLPRIREFVPRSAFGTKVYRPVARRLQAALAGVRVPTWKTWLTGPEHGLRQFAGLIQAAPPDKPIVILCFCAGNLYGAGTFKKILDHYLRQNALRHLVQAVTGVAKPGATPTPASDTPASTRVLAELDAALAVQGIREPLEAPLPVGAGEICQATVVLVADPAAERMLQDQLLSLLPGDAAVPEKVIPLSSLGPARLGLASDFGNPKLGRKAVRQWVRDAAATVANKILPVLQAKAGEFSLAFTAPASRLEPPRSDSDRAQVAALHRALDPLMVLSHATPSGHSPERVLKLLWALAYRDATLLIHHGLPPELTDHANTGNPLDDGVLWACLRNAPCLHEVIPPSRTRDYSELARWLGDCLAQLTPEADTAAS